MTLSHGDHVIRVLVTGSRDWVKVMAVWGALDEWLPQQVGDVLVVVHGECPTGADRLAKRWVEKRQAEGYAVHEEPHPADWEAYGKAAGPIRNLEMIDLGACACLAFPLPQSRGTVHCMEMAEKAGIPVQVFDP